MNQTSDHIEQIRERLNAASMGPWQAGVAATSDGSEVCTTYEQKKAFLALSLNKGGRPLWIVDNGEVIPAATGDGPNAGHNAAFIAAAPTDIGRLIAAADAVLALHTSDGHKNLIGPYCEHCISPIDGGPELWPCKTVKAVTEALEAAK